MSDRSTPARLSPVPVPARPAPLPYGLEWGDLRTSLPGFLEPAFAEITYAKQGLNQGSRSCILTLHYRGTTGEHARTLFFKRIVDPTRAEAAKLRYLSAAGVPTPRLLNVVSRVDSEVLTCEFLPIIGIEAGDADELLRLLARLNAVKGVPRDLFRAAPGIPEAEFDARIKTALRQLSVAQPVRWFDSYKRAQERTAALPTALNHGEFYFQQVGWSGSDGHQRLVLFDVETTALLPRFTDIANILDGLSMLTGRGTDELFTTYLHMLRGRSDDVPNGARARRELLSVRITQLFWSLPWLLEMVDRPNGPTAPDEAIHRLRHTLAEFNQLESGTR